MSLGARVGMFVAVVLISACVTHRPQTIAERFVRHDTARTASTPTEAEVKQDAALQASLDREMAKVRELIALPRPPRAHDALNIEQSDPELAAARAALAAAASPEHHRRVAEAYARLQVLDAAYDHFTAAVRLAGHDAAAYDGRARIWRDWGLAPLGLSDIYHAIYYAPTSPVPQNTLGTLLLKMGLVAEARVAFERALALDPRATYALANLCHVLQLQGATCAQDRND